MDPLIKVILFTWEDDGLPALKAMIADAESRMEKEELLDLEIEIEKKMGYYESVDAQLVCIAYRRETPQEKIMRERDLAHQERSKLINAKAEIKRLQKLIDEANKK